MAPELAARRRPLQLVNDNGSNETWFCGHCADRFESAQSRVCPSCGLGLLLQTTLDAAPRPRDAFLIVDSSLSVQAVSANAERELGVREEDAINHHVTELLIAGEAAPPDAASLAVAIARAAGGGGGTNEHVTVRPSKTFGVRLRARIVACGPPQAALVVLAQPAAS
jgi:PAS domain-containing protein